MVAAGFTADFVRWVAAGGDGGSERLIVRARFNVLQVADDRAWFLLQQVPDPTAVDGPGGGDRDDR